MQEQKAVYSISTRHLLAAAAAAVVLLGGLAVWNTGFRPPPDITEERAREIADLELLDFCSQPEEFEAAHHNFRLKEQRTAADSRFRWTYHFLDDTGDPWHNILIHVGPKGGTNVEYRPEPPAPGG